MSNLAERRTIRLVLSLALAATWSGFAGCASGDDNGDNNLAADDDNDDNDTSSYDDDTNDQDKLHFIRVWPPAQTVPVGTTFQFTADGYYNNHDVTDELVWSTGDEATATVDQSGLATGVANGVTDITASYRELSEYATIVVGPDVYSFDPTGGLVTAVDRGSQTGTDDFLAVSGPIGAKLNDIEVYESYLVVVDSGDSGPGIVGDEKLVVVDLIGRTSQPIALEMDSPWAVALAYSDAYVTGNQDNQLARVNWRDDEESPEYFPLDPGCVPGDILLYNEYIYVACTGADPAGSTFAPGKVLAFDPGAGEVVDTVDLPQVNPTHLAASDWGDRLYVVCTGDWVTNTGLVAQIDLAAEEEVVDAFDLGTAPGPIAIGWHGIAFVGEGSAGAVYVFDMTDNSVLRDAADPIVIPDAFWIQGLGVHPETGDVYVCDQGNSEVWVIAGADPFGTVFHVDLPNPGGVAFW